jgi:hypothetical protein
MSFLSLSLNDVDTSMPLLSEGKHMLTIAEASIAEAKNSPGCLNLKVVYTTTQPATDNKGKPLNPGYKITRFYPVPSELRDPEKNDMFRKALCLLQLAICGLPNTEDGKSQLPVFDETFIASMIGKSVIGNVRTSKTKEGDDDTYGPKSEISAVYPLN